VRKIIALAALLALVCPPAKGYCGDILQIGFQFSATAPQGPSKLTDVAGAGLHFRTFYEVVNLNDRWRLIGEFGYNNFGLNHGDYRNLVGPALEDSMNASFPLGSVFPAGSHAELTTFSIDGGDFNAMHLTAGAKYMLLPDNKSVVQPYVTAQAGLYSTGQSDSDLSASFVVQRPGLSDTTLIIPSSPWTRDVNRDNAFGFSIGGGTDFSLTDNLLLLADFRYHVAFTDETTTFLELGAGIAYRLGF
jgi:opacity protein-like surface antigen